MPLLTFTPSGLYCPPADVYIDPQKPVKKALITHAHSDHARPGSNRYLCTHGSKSILQYRLGAEAKISSIGYNENLQINGVQFSFHPAGHIPGSAQIRVECKGEVCVFSGDYKTVHDGLCEPFEPLKCHTFITESTFGLPVFRWEDQTVLLQQINQWWQENAAMGKVSILAVYALGKAQRVLQGLDNGIGTIFTHGAIENVNEILRNDGIKLPATKRFEASEHRAQLPGSMVLATPSSLNTSWAKWMKPAATAMVSGWMALRGTRRRQALDRGFALSDHADWQGLNDAIHATGAENIIVTHGYAAIFSKWLRHSGYHAMDAHTAEDKVQDDLG